MFSILNEIQDNSPARTTGVVTASIGTSGSIYILVAITGYLTFGDNVVGNIVSQCKSGPDLDAKAKSDKRQTYLQYLRPLARRQLSFLSCSPILYRFTPAVHLSMLYSSGDRTALPTIIPLQSDLHRATPFLVNQVAQVLERLR